MIARYQTEEMSQLWSEKSKYDHWYQVELAILRGLVKEGWVPEHVPNAFESNVELDIGRIKAIEAKTKHDVAAFVDHVEEQVDENVGRWFHYGVTSSDILDTATSLKLRKALQIICDDLRQLNISIAIRFSGILDHYTMGRTHGIHAEPVQLGRLARRWVAEIDRAQRRLIYVMKHELTCQVSGPVGNYSSIPQEVEEFVSEELGLNAEFASSQVIPRDRHAFITTTLAVTGTMVENIATEIRHRARTEVGEFAEGFSDGQKGSSVMPHKKNPILSENLTGLARMIRSNAMPALENVALWHERDMSHSSVERFTLPNTTALTSFALRRLSNVIENLYIDTDALERNIEMNRGRHRSRQALHTLIDAGYGRDEAYRIVQEAAFRSKKEDRDFEDVLAEYQQDGVEND